MKLRHVSIRDFRGIQTLELDIDDTTVLVGENNSGKTAVLDALRMCLRELGPRRRVVFDAFDFHLKDADAELSSSSPIQITMHFREDHAGDWDDQLVGRLSRQKILQVDNDLNQVLLRVTCAYDSPSGDFSQDWSFLTIDGQPLPAVPENALSAVQREVAYFYLGALRDAAKHFDAKGPFWRPFLKDNQLPAEKKDEIERKLRELNDLVVASHSSFDGAREQLKKVQEIVPMASGDIVAIEAVPGRIFDMLAKAEIHLGTSTGAKIPVGRHGEGTQSLAVLMLFSAFLDAWSRGSAIVALEEPEAHLHPSAVRALWSVVCGIKGQKLISTHSGDLLSEIDVHHVRRLARTSTGIRSFQVPATLLSPEEKRKLNYHVRQTRGELLFARCWLLVEGESEAWIYPAAARASGIDLHRKGVRLVEYSQSDVGVLAKVANALGISWHCVADNDSGLAKYERKVKDNLGGAKESDRLSLPYVRLEVHLLNSGYDAIYAGHMPDQNLARVSTKPGDPTYWEDYAHELPPKAKTRGAPGWPRRWRDAAPLVLRPSCWPF
jgi:putative ATP-dependent endonuclease of OLD family